jgi:hypothetical protein
MGGADSDTRRDVRWVACLGTPRPREKPPILQEADRRVQAWFQDQYGRYARLLKAMDAFEEKVRFPDREPAIYGGLGHFYSVSLQDLEGRNEVFLNVAAPGWKGRQREAAFQRMLEDHFRGKIFLRSLDRADRLPIPLEMIRIAEQREVNGVMEHPDRSPMGDVGLKGRRAAFVKVAFRVSDPTLLQDIRRREFFDIVQPGREGERILVSNEAEDRFSVDHVGDPHVRLRDYRMGTDFLNQVMAREERAFSLRCNLPPEELVQRRDQWLAVARDLFFVGSERVHRWFEYEKNRYQLGAIDFVVIEGDEIDNVNDGQGTGLRPFKDENTRLLAYFLYEAGIPVMVLPGNHSHRRPDYLEYVYQSRYNIDPSLAPQEQDRLKSYVSRMLSEGKGYGTLGIIGGVVDSLTTSASDNAVTNFFIILREIFARHLFDEHPRRQSSDDQFRGNGYLYINSEPNQVLTYKGHPFFLTDSGGDDFKFWHELLEHVPEGLKKIPLIFNLIKYLPAIPAGVDLINRVLDNKQISGKGYTGPAYQFFVRTASELVEKASCSDPNFSECPGAEATFAGHHPFFSSFKRLIWDDFGANSINADSRHAMLLFFHYFRPLFRTIISGHVHRWEAFAFSFDLSPQDGQALRRDLHDWYARILQHPNAGSLERYLRDAEALWKKHRLDDHLKIPDFVKQSRGRDVAAIVDQCAKDARACRPLFLTLPALEAMPSGAPGGGSATQTFQKGKMTGLKLNDLYYDEESRTVTGTPAPRTRPFPRFPAFMPLPAEDSLSDFLQRDPSAEPGW